jgi:hypothetical protein
MMTGQKTSKWGILPLPGVSKDDIETADRFGQPIAAALATGQYVGVQEEIVALGGIQVVPSLLFIETRAKLLFGLWARFVNRYGQRPSTRGALLVLFKWYLLIALFLVSPPVLVLYTLVVRPLTRRSVIERAQHYLYLGIDTAPQNAQLPITSSRSRDV